MLNLNSIHIVSGGFGRFVFRPTDLPNTSERVIFKKLSFRTLRKLCFCRFLPSEHFGTPHFPKTPLSEAFGTSHFQKTVVPNTSEALFLPFFAFRTLRKESFSKMTPSEVFGSTVFSPTLLPKCSEARFLRFSSLPKPSETVSFQNDSFRSVRKRSLSGDIPSETCGSFWLPL